MKLLFFVVLSVLPWSSQASSSRKPSSTDRQVKNFPPHYFPETGVKLEYQINVPETEEIKHLLLSCPKIFENEICFRKKDESSKIILDPGHKDDGYGRNGMSLAYPGKRFHDKYDSPRPSLLIEGALNKGLEMMLRYYLINCAPFDPSSNRGINPDWVLSTRHPRETQYGQYQFGAKASTYFGKSDRVIYNDARQEGLGNMIRALSGNSANLFVSLHFNSYEDSEDWKATNLFFTPQAKLARRIEELESFQKNGNRSKEGPIPAGDLSHLIRLMKELEVSLRDITNASQEQTVKRALIKKYKLLMVSEGPTAFYRSGEESKALATRVGQLIRKNVYAPEIPYRKYNRPDEFKPYVDQSRYLVLGAAKANNDKSTAILVEAGFMNGYELGPTLVQEYLSLINNPVLKFKINNVATWALYGDGADVGYRIPYYSMYVAWSIAEAIGERYACEKDSLKAEKELD